MATAPLSHDDVKIKRATALGMGEGTKYGLLTLAATSAASFGAYKFSPWYQKYMGASAKAAAPLMASLFVWSVVYEKTVIDVNRYD